MVDATLRLRPLRSTFTPRYGRSSMSDSTLVQAVVFFGVLACVLFFVAYSIYSDVNVSGVRTTSWLPFVLLGVALFIALGFEFVNGFHDTANAVATVIYTHSLPAHLAVVWSGLFNFLGVMASSGAVVYGIIALLPVELILQVRSSAGFAMVFALLIGAIVWNLGTRLRFARVQLSHADRIDHRRRPGEPVHGLHCRRRKRCRLGTSVQSRLLAPPVAPHRIRRSCAASAAQADRAQAQLYREPKGTEPPPWWIRGVLILTCTGVSFAHGSNDGQKGMGLITLILIGVVPTAYALNRAMPDSEVRPFLADLVSRGRSARQVAAGGRTVTDEHKVIGDYLRTRQSNPEVVPALARLARGIRVQVEQDHGSLRRLPAETVQNVRNDMDLASETIRRLSNDATVTMAASDVVLLKAYRGELDNATRFIPTWVKVAVAVALGLGTMVG